MTTCPKCSLPKEICVCEALAKESQLVKVWTDKRKWGRLVTIVEGLMPENFDPAGWKTLMKYLKGRLACGGTYDKKKKVLVFQGNQINAIKPLLREKGFKLAADEERVNRS